MSKGKRKSQDRWSGRAFWGGLLTLNFVIFTATHLGSNFFGVSWNFVRLLWRDFDRFYLKDLFRNQGSGVSFLLSDPFLIVSFPAAWTGEMKTVASWPCFRAGSSIFLLPSWLLSLAAELRCLMLFCVQLSLAWTTQPLSSHSQGPEHLQWHSFHRLADFSLPWNPSLNRVWTQGEDCSCWSGATFLVNVILKLRITKL